MSKEPLYQHEITSHHPSSVTVEDAHDLHIKRGGFNARIAVLITKSVGSMWTAYLFVLLALVGLLGLLNLLNPITFLLATWVSQQFLQLLVLLPVIMVGQNVLGEHNELVTEETAKNTRALLHQIIQLAKHLSAQDEEILKQTTNIDRLYSLVEAIDVRVEAIDKRIGSPTKKP